MAILIQEEKKQFNWFGLLITLAIISAVFGGVYFLFFAKPQLIQTAFPPQLKKTSELVGAKFDVTSITNSSVFAKLKPKAGELIPSQIGKDNPFASF